MAGTFTIKQLANGQLAAATGDLYTVPASTTAIVKTISLVNTNTATETIDLYVLKVEGTARRIIPKNIQLGMRYLLLYDDEITLGAGDKIQGSTTTAAKVDYVISGIEES